MEISCHDMKLIKTNRYQTRTVNITLRLHFMYPSHISCIVCNEYLGVITKMESAPIRLISITYHRQPFFRFLTKSQIRKFKYR